MSENTIDCFCMDADQKYIYAGDKSGRVLVLSVENLELLNSIQVHYGSITTIARHPKFNYLATLGNDGNIALLSANGKALSFHQLIESRNIKPHGDPYLRNHTTTQALAFHDVEKRLVGHGGSSALFEMNFSETSYELLHCTRVHGNDDFLTARYVLGTDMVLSGSVSGTAILSENGIIKRKWDFHSNGSTPSIHWFEHIKDRRYAIACDGMRVIHLDLDDDNNNVDGPIISKDHLEHTTFCHATKKLYCASFDRTVIEVNPQTCEKIKTIWEAPFKLRWIKVLEAKPNIMVVQCRNGALYKIDIDESKILAHYKTTPDALWSIAALNNKLIVGGEGPNKIELHINGENKQNRIKSFIKEKFLLNVDSYFYTKRVASSQETNFLAYGRTNGQIYIETATCDFVKSVYLPNAIRDLSFNATGDQLFAACEDGGLYVINVLTDDSPYLLNLSQVPCWALAYNAANNLLAFGDRHRKAFILNLKTMEKNCVSDNFGFIKRMKWQNADHLLIASAGSLYRYDVNFQKIEQLFLLENTVEDFDWDSAKRYFIVVNYTRFLYLCDFNTGEVLFEQGDMVDYSKGVMFLDKLANYDGYPGDFIVAGRSGEVSYNRIHDDRILSYGFI